MTNQKKMRTVSLLEIIMGVTSVLLTYFLLSKGDAGTAGLSGEKAMDALIMAYGMAAFQIFAGIVGMIRAGKKSRFTVLLGILLFIPALAHFFNAQGRIAVIVLNAVFLAIPYLYMHTAYRSLKEY